jgi:hypothetical protein
MIEVTITLHPSDPVKPSRVLYKLAIWNDEKGCYKYVGDDFNENRIPCLDEGEIKVFFKRTPIELVRDILTKIAEKRGEINA